MSKQQTLRPDSTAVRVALWRAMHVQIDAKPHVLEDEIGLQLVAPEAGWRDRPDMHPRGTSSFRASIVGRARFIEDFLEECVNKGVTQYVMLGAGLDTFVQRRSELASKLRVFEVEKPATQAWKRQRLIELGFQSPASHRFVPVDFESSAAAWWEQVVAAGFDRAAPAVVASTGVSMYLTKEAIRDTLCQMATLAPGSTFVMTFMLPLDLVEREDQHGYQMSLKGAQASGTPFISFFSPPDMLRLAYEAGFKKAEHLSTADLTPRYFAQRTDGLKPSSGEELLIATT